jgi:prepilin peptidase CpaA
MSPSLPVYIFASLVIVAATRDALSFRIPNTLTLLIAGLFFPAALSAGVPVADIGLHAAAGAAVLLAGLGLFALRLVGGGDVKLLAAAAIWLGFPALLPFLVWTAMAGGLLGLVMGTRLLYIKHVRKLPIVTDVPYGIALAAGAIIALPQSGWLVT